MLTQAVEWDFVNPPELGGLRAVYPVLDWTVQNGLFKEVRTDWAQMGYLGPLADPVDNVGDERSYDNGWTFEGNAWTIQLTARPGMYVPADILTSLGWMPEGSTAPYG